jgi:hypothetical protein
MAIATSLGITFNTTAGNKTVTATPAVDDLIVVVAGGSGMTGGVGEQIENVSDDQSGGTYTRVARGVNGGTNGEVSLWIRDSLIPSAVSTIFTMAPAGDTGGGLEVLAVAGMRQAGASAVVQVAEESTQTENPPTMTLGNIVNGDNPCIAAVLGEDNPPALTAPAGWTESRDTGYATPTTGLWTGFRNSGETAANLSWSGGALVDHCEVFVELNAPYPLRVKRGDGLRPRIFAPG